MEKFIDFKGLRHYPIGDAKLELTEKGLRVYNIGNSGLDGVSIRVKDINDFVLHFEPTKMDAKKSYTFNLIGNDELGRVKIINQQSVTRNPDNSETNVLSVNSKLLAEKVTIIGEKDGRVIFEQDYDNPNTDPRINWWIVVVAVVIYVADGVDFKRKVIRDANGNVTGTETTTSWNGSTWKMPDGKLVEADVFYLRSIQNFPEPIKKEEAVNVSEVQFLGKDLGEIVIIDETYNKG